MPDAPVIERYRGHAPRIDPSAWVHESACVLGDVTIGPRASVWPTAVLRGDQGAIVIGEATNIQDGAIAHATGGISTTTIGARVTVGHRAILHGCTVEDDCLVGMGSILLDNCHIEERCVVGAGTLVPVGMRIPAGSLVLGTPARVVRRATDKDLERIAIGCRVYTELAETYAGQKAE